MLKTTNWKDIAELVGLAAIVGSLIFVGLQMKQSHEIALSAAQQNRTDSALNMIITSAENPHFVSALSKSQSSNREPLSPDEFAVMSQYAIALLYQYENNLFQYESGFRTESRWLASKRTLTTFLTDNYPIPMRTAYEQNRGFYVVDFQNVVDDLIEEIDVNSER